LEDIYYEKASCTIRRRTFTGLHSDTWNSNKSGEQRDMENQSRYGRLESRRELDAPDDP
jgi:hypothetical protein